MEWKGQISILSELSFIYIYIYLNQRLKVCAQENLTKPTYLTFPDAGGSGQRPSRAHHRYTPRRIYSNHTDKCSLSPISHVSPPEWGSAEGEKSKRGSTKGKQTRTTREQIQPQSTYGGPTQVRFSMTVICVCLNTETVRPSRPSVCEEALASAESLESRRFSTCNQSQPNHQILFQTPTFNSIKCLTRHQFPDLYLKQLCTAS